MRALPEGLFEAQYGSLTSGKMEFTAWYDGRPVAVDLPTSEWSQTFTANAQVNGETKLTVVDANGDLAPWGFDDPLGVGGSIIQSRLILDRASVNLGWQRITSSSPEETWQYRDDTLKWVSGGGQVEVQAADLTVMVAGNKFVSPESPLAQSTCISEIRRLLLGIMDVTFEAGVEDVITPAYITYREERFNAVTDLITALGCNYRVSGTGQLVVYKPNRESVWTVKGGQWRSDLISISRSQSIDNLKNLIVAQNTLDGGDELQAAQEEVSGPLRTTGPHGKWPAFIQDDFAMNQYEIQQAAYDGLNKMLHERTVELPLETVFHPGLELGDWITVMCPLTTRDEVALEGRVLSISYTGRGTLPGSMSVTIGCDQSAVQNISYELRRRRWGDI